ncbi:MAG: M48 family metalloprotease [Anaerolineales bacterium]|nr:M48 family metalloprotease [Anaerolineales bacterium]
MSQKDVTAMTPSEWIAHIRAEHGLTDTTPYHVPNDWLNSLISHLPAKDRRKARKVWNSRQGRPAYQIYDELMKTYTEQIEPILQSNERQVFLETNFAVFPTHQFNGYAGFTPRGDRVIILHQALGVTLNFWSFWYLRVFEEGNNYLTDNPVRLAETCKYIMRVWNGLQTITPLPDIYPRTNDSWELSETMTLSAISFVLGHELGHVLHNHTSYTNNRDANHAMEFEADQIGLSIAIRHSMIKSMSLKQDNYFAKFGLFAPLFALSVMSIFGDTPTNTHPSPTQRKEKLLLAYRDIFSDIFDEKDQEIWDWVDENLQRVLEYNSSNLFELMSVMRDITQKIPISPPARDISWLTHDIKFTES